MKVHYIPEGSQIIDKPLSWHLEGLQQTASGYGKALVSTKCVLLPGETRPRRVYVTLYGNAGSAWIKVQGKRLYLRDMDN